MRISAIILMRILMRILTEIPMKRILMKKAMAEGACLTRRPRTDRRYWAAGCVSVRRDAGRENRNFALFT